VVGVQTLAENGVLDRDVHRRELEIRGGLVAVVIVHVAVHAHVLVQSPARRHVVNHDVARGVAANRVVAIAHPYVAAPETHVPDDDIVKVGIQLAQHLTPDEDRIVAHTSGVLNADVLSAALPHHKLVASMHPVQTLSGSEKDWKRLFNITYGIQGSPAAVHRLKNIP